jgi:hypothetical protein
LATNYRQVFAIQKKNEQRMLAVNPNLNHKPGIYFLTRKDEEGIRHGYVGLAHDVLKRLGQHLSTFQYIDNSIRKHGLYATDNPHGYKVNFINCKESELEKLERYYIVLYASAGYQMKNRDTGGGQGKQELGERKAPKGFRQGIQTGKRQLARDLSGIIKKHLDVKLKPEKQNNKVSQKQEQKFWELLDERNYE